MRFDGYKFDKYGLGLEISNSSSNYRVYLNNIVNTTDKNGDGLSNTWNKYSLSVSNLQILLYLNDN